MEEKNNTKQTEDVVLNDETNDENVDQQSNKQENRVKVPQRLEVPKIRNNKEVESEVDEEQIDSVRNEIRQLRLQLDLERIIREKIEDGYSVDSEKLNKILEVTDLNKLTQEKIRDIVNTIATKRKIVINNIQSKQEVDELELMKEKLEKRIDSFLKSKGIKKGIRL